MEHYHFKDDGIIPNNHLPIIVYREVCTAIDKSEWFESTFKRNGWTNNWRDIILPYDHFHSTTHEVLGVGRGSVTVQIGGQLGRQLKLHAGDMVVIPAGVGHYSISNEESYEIVGGYPEGKSWDLLRGNEGGRDAVVARIASLPIPTTDPIGNEQDDVPTIWSKSNNS